MPPPACLVALSKKLRRAQNSITEINRKKVENEYFEVALILFISFAQVFC
jgi:hypothetical protein